MKKPSFTIQNPSPQAAASPSREVLRWLLTYTPKALAGALDQMKLPEEKQVWTEKDEDGEIRKEIAR